MSPRRICVVTTSRADYGLLRWLMQAIHDDDELELQVIATAMHLSPEFGLTYRDVERDGFFINRKVEILLSSDTAVPSVNPLAWVSSASPMPMTSCVRYRRGLGDRFELWPSIAALIARIPIAHIHGGETSEGAVDEGNQARHHQDNI